jgi:hypothetical protein
MSTNYIEIDSTYRDRNKFPLPSEFDVIISQSGLKGKKDAIDPVCDSAPVYIFNKYMINDDTSDIIYNLEIVNPVSAPSTIQSPTDPNKLLIKTAEQLRPETDFYVGCSMGIYATPPATNVEYRRIVGYEYAGSDSSGYYYGIFTPAYSYPTTVLQSGIMPTPTPVDTSSVIPANSTPRFWVPKGSIINNYYVNYYIDNIPSIEYKKIIAYNGDTRFVTLESPTIDNWNFRSAFCIRKELPLVVGVVFLGPGEVTLDTVYMVYTIQQPLSDVKDFYVGDYIRFTYSKNITPNQMSFSPFNQMRKITSYDPVTKKLTFYPSVLVTQDALDACLSTGPPLNIYFLQYEILGFSRDNFSPFNYIGSIVSSQQQVCYDIELRNIVIPNFLLKSGRGGRIVFYPYIYVEFFPISDSSTNPRGILCSNNPNSYKMLFRAIVSDTQQQEISPFIKLGGDGQVHTIKFKPNDSFHFAVYNSEGELLQFSQPDNYSPVAPNPLVQISAMFTIRRVA